MNMTARTLLEALMGAWPKLSRIGDRQVDLKTLPLELRTLAENAYARDERLEHLGTKVLYSNN